MVMEGAECVAFSLTTDLVGRFKVAISEQYFELHTKKFSPNMTKKH
jgi:hypothetical protein